MRHVAALVDRIPPDTIHRLQRAAQHRFETAEILVRQRRRLAAVYLYGYSAEMCLFAAYFRRAGFTANAPIDRDTRRRRMAQARQLQAPSGEPLMNSDPHHLVGWARFLNWQAHGSGASSESQRLKEAVNKAVVIYRHWRPELRYKTTDVQLGQLEEVRRAAIWFVENRDRI